MRNLAENIQCFWHCHTALITWNTLMVEFNDFKAQAFGVTTIQAILQSLFLSDRAWASMRCTQKSLSFKAKAHSLSVLLFRLSEEARYLMLMYHFPFLVMLHDTAVIFLSIFKANTINVLIKERKNEYAGGIRTLNEGWLFNKLLVFTFSENVIMELKDIQKQSTVS